MKTNILKTATSFVVIICLLTFNAQQSNAQKSHAVKHEKSLLWEISGNGLEQPSYLFGTIHIIDSSYYSMEETVKEKLSKCDKLVTEIDTDDPNFQQKTIFASLMKTDSLDNLLSKEEYEKVEAFFTEKLQIPLQAVKKIKPLYLAEMPAILTIPKNSKSYEEELVKIAKGQGKEVLGITTIEKESEIIDGISLEVQTQLLVESVDNQKFEEDKRRREKVMSLYQKQDIDAILNTMKAATAEYEIVFDVMFHRRHEVWIPNIEKLMKEHTCFFAVGVGHLAGEEGIIELLKKQGYEVKSVK